MIIILSISVILVIIGVIIICFSYFFKFNKIEFNEFENNEQDEFEEDESDEDFYKLLGSTKYMLNIVGFVFIVIGIALFFLYKYF